MLLKLNNQRIRSAVAGGLGGLAGWFLNELLAGAWTQGRGWGGVILFGASVGLCIGVVLSVASEISMRSTYRMRRSVGTGAIVGLFGGLVGVVLGNIIYQLLSSIPFIGRSVGWAIFGALVGVAEGITRQSQQGMRAAALGGLIGGAIGGFAFDLIDQFALLRFGTGVVHRAVALTILGACIGLWIVIMERRLSPATLKIVSGRFEGREFYLDKPSLTLGSDERGDIAVFGDADIRGHHATLSHAGTGYLIEAASGASVLVNKQPVGRQSLVNEDELLIGSTRLIYRDKSGATTRTDSEPAAPVPAWSPPSVTPIPPSPPAAPRPLAMPGTVAQCLTDVQTGQRYNLRVGSTTIGRAPDNNIVLNGATVSGYHAEIRYENGQHVLYDKNSRNGSFVNGRRISAPNLVRPGWRIMIGDVELVVES